MAAGTETATVFGLSLAMIFGAAPMGIPMSTIAIGSVFAMCGCLGRAAFEFQKLAEGAQGGMSASKILRWVGAGFLGAPFMAVLTTVILKSIGVQLDSYAVMGFLVLGFWGPSAISSVMTSAADLMRKRFQPDSTQGDSHGIR